MSLFSNVFHLHNNRNVRWVEETDLFSPGLEKNLCDFQVGGYFAEPHKTEDYF